MIYGTDGVGYLSDGKRVFFGGARPPYGAMAERTVAKTAFCFPVPDELNDETAAALLNPGVSAWLSLVHLGKLKTATTSLVLGATGTTGKLAVKSPSSLVREGLWPRGERTSPEHAAGTRR